MWGRGLKSNEWRSVFKAASKNQRRNKAKNGNFDQNQTKHELIEKVAWQRPMHCYLWVRHVTNEDRGG